MGARPTTVTTTGRASLADEPSPYLQDHADDPVRWWPWGEAAFAHARAADRPIFLSIGYATCHWCGVMHRESFRDDEVASRLNESFVPIKVDREQRPDVDAIYTDAVGRMGIPTGWPLTVVLTPSLEPFFGGTYFPREASEGMPGLLDVLAQARELYAEEGQHAARRGRALLEALAADARPTDAELDVGRGERAIAALARLRDQRFGGYGSGAKFPRATLLMAELDVARRTGRESGTAHVARTLDAMRRGAIRDPLGGTFHRYTEDAQWVRPHYEKTLYDSALLAGLYLRAGRATATEPFIDVAREIFDGWEREWRNVDGTFAAGFAADDAGGEGAYHRWTYEEVVEVAGAGAFGADGGPDAGRVAALFGLAPNAAAAPLVRISDAAARVRFGLDEPEASALIERALGPLREARTRRPAPPRDDKVLVAWNAMAIAALAEAGRWLAEPRYVRLAAEAADALVACCWRGGRLRRGVFGELSLGAAPLEDHAHLVRAMLRLHHATGELRWLVVAGDVERAMHADFFDAARGVFLATAAGADVPMRRVEASDGEVPAPSVVAALATIELGEHTGDRGTITRGRAALAAIAEAATREPTRAGSWVSACEAALGARREVVLVGDPEDARTRALWQTIAPHEDRLAIVRLAAAPSAASLERFPSARGKVAIGGAPTAYVCELGRCERPTSDPSELARQLRPLVAARAQGGSSAAAIEPARRSGGVRGPSSDARRPP